VDFATDFALVSRAHRRAIEDALKRLARWMLAHPDATPEETMRTQQYKAVLVEFDAEIRDMHGAMVEVLPAMIEDAVRDASR